MATENDSSGAEVGIVTPDAHALAAFYVDGLGFTIEAVHEFPLGSVHRLRRGQARCKLFQPGEGVTPQERTEPWYSRQGVRYGALLVDDAQRTVDRARAAGAEIVQDVVAHRPGARYALIRDPEGNIWEILEERLPR